MFSISQMKGNQKKAGAESAFIVNFQYQSILIIKLHIYAQMQIYLNATVVH